MGLRNFDKCPIAITFNVGHHAQFMMIGVGFTVRRATLSLNQPGHFLKIEKRVETVSRIESPANICNAEKVGGGKRRAW